MSPRRKPLVDGAESGLDMLRHEIKNQIHRETKSYRERFLEIARQISEEDKNPVKDGDE